jgi:MFS family permease
LCAPTNPAKRGGISTEWVFYVLRFLLGLAEAGFFPGIIFYLTLWFPSVYRARVVSLFMLAIPFSSIGMVLLGRNSDRTLKRREHVCFAMLLAAVGVAGAGLVSAPGTRVGLALPEPDRRFR